MLQYYILKKSSSFLRWYRTRLLLDWERISSFLPIQGKLLDVGCGVGLLEYEIARSKPDLSVFGIDIVPESIELARSYHAQSNIDYACQPIQSVEGLFDCVLFVDVFHHVDPGQYAVMLEASKRLLAPDGYVLIKDVERRRGQISLYMDRYISGCKAIYMHDCNELVDVVSKHLNVVSAEVKFRFPFPHYYIKAVKG